MSALSRTSLRDFVDRSYLVRDEADALLIRLAVGRENERVCHGKGSSVEDFFFVYATFFDQLHIRIPFINFQMGVLRALNVAPTQLHPNAWAAIQSFGMMCLAAGVIPPFPPSFTILTSILPEGGLGFFDFCDGSDIVQAIFQVLQEF